jgi:hypothetical protein
VEARFDEVLAVHIVQEYPYVLVATAHHMTQRTGISNAQLARLEATLATPVSLVKRDMHHVKA